MKQALKAILPWIVVGILATLNVLQCSRRNHPEEAILVQTDTLTVFDTVTYYQPVPRDSVVIRYITQTLPVAQPVTDNPDTTEQDGQPVTREPEQTEPSRDSIAVKIPIEQKVYETEDYRAYVSGYRPALDSLILFSRTQTITNTLQTRTKPKRWGIGVQVGYGFTPQGAQPYIGVGISYNLFRF